MEQTTTKKVRFLGNVSYIVLLSPILSTNAVRYIGKKILYAKI
jgi:hypothetical protein